MSRSGYPTEHYLRGAGSPWALPVLGAVWGAVVWGAVAVLVLWWGVTAWRKRRRTAGARKTPRDATRAPRHAATGLAAGPAVSVREIAQRLDREQAARARRPPRRVAVIHREAPPPDTEPIYRFSAPEDGTTP